MIAGSDHDHDLGQRAFPRQQSLGLWVPACAGTTTETTEVWRGSHRYKTKPPIRFADERFEIGFR
jgi:hypothetical protein